MANMNPRHAVTGLSRFSYESIMKPSLGPNAKPGDAPRYSVTILMPKSDTAAKARIDAAIEAAKQYGAAKKIFKEGTPLDRLQTVVYDGDGFRRDGYTRFGKECAGCWVFTASTPADKPPVVVDGGRNPIIDPTEIYSGMYGRVGVDFFPYSTGGNQGIGCSLINVQKLRDGEPLAGARASVDDDFGDDLGDIGNTAYGQAFDPLS